MRVSMEHHVRVTINAPGCSSLHITYRNPTTLLEKGEVIVNNRGVTLTLFIHCLEPPFLPW